MRQGRRAGAATMVAALVSLCALAGCSSSNGSSESVGSTSSSAPTTTASAPTTTTPTSTTVPAADAAILAAYRAEWAAYEHALATANPLDPGLAATMVNPLLHQVEGYLVAYHEEGIVGRGSIALDPRVASLGASAATVLDCQYSASLLYYKASGKEVPPITKPEHDGVKATLVLDGSTWKMKSQHVTEGSCPAGY